MNSKERVQATLEGRIPDRVPWGEFAVDFDTVERIIGHETYFRAKAKSRIAFWEGRHDEVAESYRHDHIELHRRLDLDIVTFPLATWEIPPESDDPPPRKVDESTWVDRYGRVFKYSAQSEDITCVRDPVEEARTFSPDDFRGTPAAPERDVRSWAVLEAVIGALKNEKFICGPSGGIVGLVLPGGLVKAAPFLVGWPELIEAATARLPGHPAVGGHGPRPPEKESRRAFCPLGRRSTREPDRRHAGRREAGRAAGHGLRQGRRPVHPGDEPQHRRRQPLR